MSEVQNKILVSVDGDDTILDYTDLGLTFDSTEAQVLQAIRPLIMEAHNVDIQGGYSNLLYKTRKAIDSQNIYVIPNSTAG